MKLLFTDFKNVSIVGHYVKDRTKDAQFIIIRYAYYFSSLLSNLPFLFDSISSIQAGKSL